MDYLKEYYESRDEDGRLASRHGQVEFLTTMKYIHECAGKTNAKSVIEIGAGTGRYSIALAKQGFTVTAVELVEHNLDILRNNAEGVANIEAYQGSALDLSRFADGAFDLTLVLGPMYHLYTFEDKKQALSEAVRVTKPGGYILVAYCMNEPTVIQYVFKKGNLQTILENNMITEDWHCKSEPKEVFELVRTEDIAEIDKTADVTRIKLAATDGPTHYMSGLIDEMDEETFEKWMEFHYATCERQDLVGASNHTLDILKKIQTV